MIETDMAGWDRHPDGEIEILPLAAFAAARLGGAVALRLEILQPDGLIGTAQIAMPADRAMELGHALLILAQQASGSEAPAQ